LFRRGKLLWLVAGGTGIIRSECPSDARYSYDSPDAQAGPATVLDPRTPDAHER
jgi:hypothetical protein